MYAVIRTGGKQYRVKPGDLLVVEKLDGQPGANVQFADVLMLGEGEAVTVGAPLVAGAKVEATLIETRKGEKVKIFKKIRRQGYRRTKGHRQLHSVLRVTAIAGAGKEAKWDGEVKLATKAELDARARGLTLTAPKAEAAPSRAKPAAATKAKAAEQVEAKPAQAKVNAPPAEAPAKKPAAKKPVAGKAAAPKAEAGAKKPAAKKASEPKGETKKAAPKKTAAKKTDKGAK